MISKEYVVHFSQSISEKFKETLRKYQAQFREKLRQLRLMHYNGFLIKNKVYHMIGLPDIISHILAEKPFNNIIFRNLDRKKNYFLALKRNRTHGSP